MNFASLAKILNARILNASDHYFTDISTDSRTLQCGDVYLALEGPNFNGHDFMNDAYVKGASGLIVGEAKSEIPLPQLEVPDTLEALSKIANVNRRNFNGVLVAITGSCGKTTVKEMLFSILSMAGKTLATKGNLNNHIGVPLTLLKIRPDHDFAVIEMGASVSGDIESLAKIAEPEIAMVTNVNAAHIQGFGSLQGVANEKVKIYSGLGESGTAIVNVDDKFADFFISRIGDKKMLGVTSNSRKLSAISNYLEAKYCTEKKIGSASFTLLFDGNSTEISLNVLGMHNVQNALCAAAAALCAGLDLDAVKRGLERFRGVEGRMQCMIGRNGASVVNDSYNANPGSVRAAIDYLSGRDAETFLVLGDMGELGADEIDEHAQIGQYARKSGVQHLLTVGDLSTAATKGFGEGAKHFESKEALVSFLESRLASNAIVLVKGSRSARMEQIVEKICSEEPES